ncbi:MAG: ammonia-forming cytochrome c nitrite reductase subunit c552 [Phycisphaeraceae bacterium]|nr:ammonia-forming cytochrome c nitrite reductase subunit c552 [Phycisphaeraceae bacterium]
MQSSARRVREPAGRAAFWLVLVVVFAATIAVMLLLRNIAQRKREAATTFVRVVETNESTVDPAVWGKNFPDQYDTYMRTVDTTRTRYGGSEDFQKLDSDPALRTLFDGYAFSIDYREERGHAYMLSDQRETKRVTERKQPGACLQCHASNVVAYREVGLKNGAPGTVDEPLLSANGLAQLNAGFDAVCAMPYSEATALVDHAISCLDCHDPGTMALRVTRPGFMRGIAALAASAEPVPHLPSVERWRAGSRSTPYDPNTMASRQEMRSFACAQCHVEYYFKGKEKTVTYPWAKGVNVDQVEAYYDEAGFSDWKHPRSGADLLKAQHPEFETWSQGVHARSGVSCADCHMPYQRVGAMKYSSHHVRSPMLSIAASCQTCHPQPEAELLARVNIIQDRTKALMSRSEQAAIDLITALEEASKSGVSDDKLAAARALLRKAQWRLDFVNAENSMGFHAPQESARILADSIDYSRQGMAALNAVLHPPAKRADAAAGGGAGL